jgi:hypothetical protein
MPIRILFSFITLFCSISYGQIGGKSTYQFLNLVTAPRQAALGGKTITIYDNDVNQANFNPASINEEMHNNLAVNYGKYFGEVSYGAASYAYQYNRYFQTIQVGVNYVNYGEFDGYDENGLATTPFSGSEVALSFGSSLKIPNTKLYVGMSGKVISSTLENFSSLGGAADIGALYIDQANDINWAVVIRNIGTQFTTYNGLKEKIPLEILMGVSQELENVPVRWHLTFENLQQWNVSFANPNNAKANLDGTTTQKKNSFLGNAIRHTIFGVELFPQKSFNVRMGYNFRRSAELQTQNLRSFSGISLGFGIKLSKLKVNYSYSRYTLAGNTSLFGLTINL